MFKQLIKPILPETLNKKIIYTVPVPITNHFYTQKYCIEAWFIRTDLKKLRPIKINSLVDPCTVGPTWPKPVKDDGVPDPLIAGPVVPVTVMGG